MARGRRGISWLVVGAATVLLAGACGSSGPPGVSGHPGRAAASVPAPPKAEPIDLKELAVPPTAPSANPGACTSAVNPRGTGCISAVSAGGFLDDHTVLATLTYTGAPAAPDPASVYSGSQLAMIRTDGKKFPDGSAWQCLTCGIPAANKAGASTDLGAAQPFADGSRILAGNNIVDCGQYRFTDPRCTAAAIHVYPIRWNTTADGSGAGGLIYGLKLNPDNVHVGWNRILFPATADDTFSELAYYGRLTFDPKPAAGEPRVARYDLTEITGLFSADEPFGTFLRVDPANPTRLTYQQNRVIGEFKGWTGDGTEALGIADVQSDNLDHVATSLATGATRRLDADPAYSDPVTSSPDSQWTVAMDVRYHDRFSFFAALPGVPPITDALPTGAAESAGYNIHDRRLFEPYLYDRYGDRGDYHGQQVNTCATGPCTTLATGPGSTADDPLWASRADSYFSPDGTQIVYGQTYPAAADCGPAVGDPATCPPSSEPGGRTSRLMLARLTSRTPRAAPAVKPLPDTVAWGTPYHAGDPTPVLPHLPAGTYTLSGRTAGTAAVTITENSTKTGVMSISVTYTNYDDDGTDVINGTESVQNKGTSASDITFHENLNLTGKHTGTKKTSEPGGYTISPRAVISGTYNPVGTMTTTLDGHTYNQPGSF
ncbi:hypothetical protein [Frankia sp. AgW1.1]|uniref:hypothetical protein n=1 Tax=Frankia sp. AgW1.1 TaxID=1836971 RepID=UPI0027DB4158|nr:hypothetical protein [Frankia sp. AgW1.1]